MQTNLSVNMFPLSIPEATLTAINHYAVIYQDQVEQQTSKRAIGFALQQISEEYLQTISEQLIIDYPLNKRIPVTSFYSRTPLNDSLLDTTYTYPYLEKKRPLKCRFQLRKIPNFGHQNAEKCRFINLIVKESLESLNFYQIKNSYFDPKTLSQSFAANTQVAILQGFRLTSSIFNNNLMLQLLPENTRFQCKTVSQFVKEHMNNRRFIKNLTIMTLHNGLQYKIDSIDSQQSVNSKMSQNDPNSKTYLEHFLAEESKINQVYQKVLKIPSVISTLQGDNYMLKVLPVSKIKKGRIRRGCFLPPGLCIITSDPTPNFAVTKDVKTLMQLSPETILERAKALVSDISNNQIISSLFNIYNLKIESRTADLKIEQINPPTIMLNSEVNSQQLRQHLSSFPPANSLMYRSENQQLVGGIKHWGVLGANSANFRRGIDQIIRNVKQIANVFPEHNRIAEPVFEVIPHVDPNNVRNYINDYLDGFKQLVRRFNSPVNEISLILIVLPGRNKQYNAELYRELKLLAVSHGIVTQCIIDSNMSKNEILGGISQQIYAKCGGIVWQGQLPENRFSTKTMICALDVSRPKVQTRGNTQISAGFVSSYYQTGLFLAQARKVVKQVQAGEIQRGGEIADYINSALRGYYKFQPNQQQLPEKIIFYRDGVADGQINEVSAYEVESVIQEIRKIYKEQPCELVFLVCQKSSGMRFCGGKVPAGSFLLDGENFYMASQEVIEGVTPKPVRYQVIYHKMISGAGEEKVEGMQDLVEFTNCLCYGYVNWPQAIQCPNVLHYAHLLSKFQNEVLGGQEGQYDVEDMGIGMRQYYI